MKEVNKPNDIFVSTLLNPTADIPDLLANGVNGANTGLLPYSTYKNSLFVLQAFTNKDGVFDNDLFTKVYQHAEKKFNELLSVLLYKDLSDYTKFNENDIYAPIQSQKSGKTYEMKKVRNPFRVSEGVSSLFGKGESDYSNRELAQMHKVWDSENEQWLDYTAEDLGFLGLKYLGRKSLVYATWDSDGVHYDPVEGREVRHKKGEWKTDENGMFYTETIGTKEGYGKEYVAYSDILSKEDSWANNIDFFDSDDKKKSIGGIVAKTAAAVLPYLFPVAREVWGGITAAVSLASVLPTFAKMAEGIVVGDKETGFTKSMSTIENYFKKFDKSTSDSGKQSMINFESLMSTIGDVYGLLYQMRAAASLSNLYNKSLTKAQQASFDSFREKFGLEWAAAKAANPKDFVDSDSFVDLWKQLVDSTPEMKALIEKQSSLSKALSLGYMAMTSSADVYEDAILGGYDRRMAGLAGFMATAGQFGIMYNNKLGDWFLDATTGYKSDVSRNIMRKTMRPYYDKIAEAADKLVDKAPKDQKISILSKLYTNIFLGGPKKLKDILVYGGEELWKNGLIEGVEEITEEAVMDATKGVFDTLSAIGIGKNAGTASFGGWDNVFSAEGAQRYLMSFIGGAVGGTLFEFLRTKVQPWMDAIAYGKTPPETRYSLIQEIMNGNTEELLAEVDRMCANDNQVLNMGDQTSDKAVTRGETIAKALKLHIRFVESIITDEGIKLDQLDSDALIKRVVRTKLLQPVIESSGLMDMIQADFVKMVDDLVSLKSKAYEKVDTDDDDDKNKKKNKKDDKSDTEKKPKENKELDLDFSVSDTATSKLNLEILNKKKEIVDFLNGNREEEYVKTALIYLQPVLRYAALGVDKYSWTQSKYGVDYSTLQDKGASLSKEKIDKEYKKWKESEDNLDKFRMVGVKAFDLMEKDFSPSIKEYITSAYGKTRSVVINKVLGKLNFHLASLADKQDWRDHLKIISQELTDAGIIGMSLEDQLLIGEKTRKKIIDSLPKNLDKMFELITEEINNSKKPEELKITAEAVKGLFEEALMEDLQSVPLTELTPALLDNFVFSAYYKFAEILANKIFTSLGPEVTLELAKQVADLTLVQLGFSPINEAIVLEGDPIQDLAKYIGQVAAPRTSLTENIDLTFDILEEYLASEEILDDEIVRKIKQGFYNQVNAKKAELLGHLRSGVLAPDMVEVEDDEGDFIKLLKSFRFKNTLTALEVLMAKLHAGLDENLSIEEIVEDWLYSEIDGVVDVEHAEYKTLLKVEPKAREIAIKTASDFINSIPSASLYDSIRKKKTKANPLFNKLREFGQKVFDGKDITLFELLEAESSYMLTLPNIGEYIRMGVTKESIDNFISKLLLLAAVIAGMEDSGIDPEHQIAYNVLMKRWDAKWHDGKNADKYLTISSEEVHYMLKDLELLINKLGYAKTLIETNTTSKLGDNLKAQRSYENIIVEKIKEAGLLTIKGVSVLPPKEKIESIEDSSEQLALIEHSLFEAAKKLAESGEALLNIVKEICEALDINRDKIIESGLHSNGIYGDMKDLSEYDIFSWIVSSLATDSYEFNYRYKEVLNSDTYKFAPLFIQELAAKMMYSFAKDTNNIHKAAVEWLFEGLESPSVQKATQIFFLNGIAGAGKTEAVMSIVKTMLGSNNILISGPNTNLALKLKKSLGKMEEIPESVLSLNKQELLSKFFTQKGINALSTAEENIDKEGGCVVTIPKEDGSVVLHVNISDDFIKELDNNEVPKYIFIDEVTHFNVAELKALDMAAKKYGIKIIAAGDTLQKGATMRSASANIGDIFAWKSPALTISVRAGNSWKKGNIDLIQLLLRKTEKVINEQGFKKDYIDAELNQVKTISYYQTDNELHGDKLVGSITVNDLKVIKKASAGGKSVMIISNVDANGDLTDKALENKLKEAGFNKSDYVVYSPDDFSDYAVQGAEADYVIVDQMPPRTDNSYLDLITFYTYLSRSLVGSLIKVGDYKSNLKLHNTAFTYTSDYSLPGLDQQEKLKDEKVKIIEKIIGNYEPPKSVVSEKPSEPKIKVDTSISLGDDVERTAESPLTEDLKKEYQSLVAEREDRVRNGDTGEDLGNTISKSNFEGKVDYVFGWGFYNHTGTIKDNYGNHYSIATGKNLDMDGLFGPEKRMLSPNVIRGFVMFKNLLALHHNDPTKLISGLNNPDILDFFIAAYPKITSSEELVNKRKDAYNWLIDHLKVDADTYAFAYKYNSKTDTTVMTIDGTDAQSNGSTFITYGKRIYCQDEGGNMIFNQYITLGAMPSNHTLKAYSVDDVAFKALLDKAEKALETSTKKIEVFKLPGADITPTSGLRLYKNIGMWVSIKTLKDEYGVVFDEDKLGMPKVRLITNDRIKYNGIDSFAFLHYLVLSEHPKLDTQSEEEYKAEYQRRINKLQEIFVSSKDPNRLIVAGKYFATARFTTVAGDQYMRSVILEPSDEMSYLQAYTEMLHLKNATRLKNVSNEKKTGILEERATYMSQSSQMLLLTAVFKLLNCIDLNGQVVKDGDGLLPYIEAMLEDIGTKDTSSKASRQFNETLSQLKADYKDNGIPFDMSIISKLMRTQRRAGVIIMDYMLLPKRNDSKDIIGLQVRLLENEHGVRDVRPLNNFNVNTLAFREFGVGYDHDTNLPGLAEGMVYEPPLIDIREEHLNALGINNHMVEMPTVKLSNESLQNAELVTNPLTHVEIEYGEVTEEEKEPEIPLVPTTESFDELSERFIPTRDIVKVVPSTRGRFYLYVDMTLEARDKMIHPDHIVYTETKHNVGFQLRIGDTVLLFGDKTHTYTITDVHLNPYTGYKTVYFAIKDGKPVKKEKLPVHGVSAIVGRTMPKKKEGVKGLSPKADFYQTEHWAKVCASWQMRQIKDDPLIGKSDVTDDLIKSIIASYQSVLIYPVLNSDDNVFSKLARAVEEKEATGSDLAGVGVIATNDAKSTKEAIQNLLKTSNLNGIVIAKVPGGLGKFGTSQKDTLAKVKPEDIIKYVSVTTAPKFQEEVKPAKSKKSKGETKVELKKAEETKKAEDQAALLKDTLALFNSNRDSFAEQIVSDNYEGLDKYNDKYWFKYQDSDTKKWHIVPKIKAFEVTNTEYKMTDLERQLIMGILPGTKIYLVTEGEELTKHLYFIDSISDSEVKIRKEGSEGNHPIPLEAFALLWGTKYIPITESTKPVLKPKAKPKASTPLSIFSEKQQDTLSKIFTNFDLDVLKSMEEVISSFKNRQVIEYSDESIITAFIALCTKDREVNYDSSNGDTSYPWDFDGDPTRYNGLLDTLAENYNLDSKEDNLDNLCF